MATMVTQYTHHQSICITSLQSVEFLSILILWSVANSCLSSETNFSFSLFLYTLDMSEIIQFCLFSFDLYFCITASGYIYVVENLQYYVS